MSGNKPNLPPAWLWTPGDKNVGIEQLHKDYPFTYLDEVVNDEQEVRIPWTYDRGPNPFTNTVNQAQAIAERMNYRPPSGLELLHSSWFEPLHSSGGPTTDFNYDYNAALMNAEARCEWKAKPEPPPTNASQWETASGQIINQYRLFEESPLLRNQKSRDEFKYQENFSYSSVPYVLGSITPTPAGSTSAAPSNATNVIGSASAAQGASGFSMQGETAAGQIPTYKGTERFRSAKKQRPKRPSHLSFAPPATDVVPQLQKSYSLVAAMRKSTIDRQATFVPNNLLVIDRGQPSRSDPPDEHTGSITFKYGVKLTQSEKKRVEKFRRQTLETIDEVNGK